MKAAKHHKESSDAATKEGFYIYGFDANLKVAYRSWVNGKGKAGAKEIAVSCTKSSKNETDNPIAKFKDGATHKIVDIMNRDLSDLEALVTSPHSV